jgi:hypothetical protein
MIHTRRISLNCNNKFARKVGKTAEEFALDFGIYSRDAKQIGAYAQTLIVKGQSARAAIKTAMLMRGEYV